MDIVFGIAQKIYVLQQGAVLAAGQPKDIKEQIRKIDSGDIKPPAFMNKEIEEKLEAIPEETVEQAKSLLGPDKEEPQQSESLLGV